MADATISVEAKLVDQMSAGLRAIQHEMALLEKTTFDSANGIKKEMAALRKSSEGTSDSAVKSLKRMGGAILGAAAAYVTVSTAARVAGSSIEASLSQQRIGRGLEFATGSAEAGARALGFVREEAGRLGLDLRSAAMEFTKLSAAAKGTSLEGQGARDIFVGVSEAATVLGLSSDQAGGALNAIQQMISKGTVAAEELRGQLGERLPGAFQIAARSMGVTTQELGKMLEQGQVMADDFLPKFAVELHKTFGADAVNASKQGQAGLNRFNTAIFEAKSMLGDALLPALLDVTNEISDLIKEGKESGALAEDFKQIAEAAMSVASAINTVAGATARWIGKEADQSKIMDIYKELRANDPLSLPADLMAQAQERFKLLKEAAKLADEERKKGFGRPGMGQGAAPVAPVSRGAAPLSKDQEKTLIKLQMEVEAARIAATEDGLKKRLAIEDMEYRFRLKEAGEFGKAREQIEQLHIQNIANIKQDENKKAVDLWQKGEEQRAKAREKEFAEARKEAEEQGKITAELNERIAKAEAGDDKMAVLAAGHLQELELFKGTEEQKTLLLKAQAAEREQVRKQENEASLQAMGTLFGGLANLTRQANMHDRENRIRYKALAIAEATVNTYLAATKALASAPPPWNFIAMGGVVAAGLAQVGMIKDQKFAAGGPVHGPSHAGGGVRAELEGGEFVLSRQDVRRFGGMDGVEAMRRGGGSRIDVGGIHITLSGSATQEDAERVGAEVGRTLRGLKAQERDAEFTGARA